MPTSKPIAVYLETGQKKVFAGAVDWPGWCRSARDAQSALQSLFDDAPRYARALQRSGIAFELPATLQDLAVVEELPGSTTTDFGAPDASPTADQQPVSDADLARLQSILQGCWLELDTLAAAAVDKALRLGPRGGGRDREAILRHVLGADQAYLSSIGKKFTSIPGEPLREELARTRQAILDQLAAAARGEVPARGPRGGLRWTPRYFVRRVAWHTLDHAWEIEDRTL
jgi:hypothetical protein